MSTRTYIAITAFLVAALAMIPIMMQSKRIAELERELRDQPAPHSKRSDGNTSRKGTSSGASGAATVSEALDIEVVPLRRSTLLETGYQMAESDLEGALAALADIEDASDRREFLRGVFTYVAHHHPPSKVLEMAKQLELADRGTALLAAVGVWTEGRSIENGQAENLIKRFGLETGLAVALAWDEGFEMQLGEAWIEAFPDGPGRSLMLGSFAAKLMEQDREAALAMGDHLTGYEREMFLLAVIDAWSPVNPDAAWEWALENVQQVGDRSRGIIMETIQKLAQRDRETAKEALGQLTEPEHRLAAIKALATVMAYRDGTVEAVNWANSLPSEAEQDMAHSVIGVQAPQGIGAALAMKDGYVEITKLIPGGAALRSGQLQEGDRIVEVDPGTGDFEIVYGQPDLNRAVEFIRGETGSTVRLRIVRPDAQGRLQDQIVSIRREQIVMPAAPPDEDKPSES